jgi:hypothetical protein
MPRPITSHARSLHGEIRAVDVGDLELAARGRLEIARDVEHAVVVKVEPGDRVARLRHLRLFLEAHDAPGRVELRDAVALGVGDRIREHGRSVLLRGRALELHLQVVAVEDVVAEHQRRVVAADEVAADHERLREAGGRRLHRVRQRQPPARPVAEGCANRGVSSGVLMSRMSRIPASISVDSG